MSKDDQINKKIASNEKRLTSLLEMEKKLGKIKELNSSPDTREL